MLENLGFQWNLHEEIWMKYYNELVAYHDTNGHCNVPRCYEANPQLGRWLHEQRFHYKKGKLKGNHIAMLENLGFQWNLHEEIWLDTAMSHKDTTRSTMSN
jgi:uncharacterized membrane protein